LRGAATILLQLYLGIDDRGQASAVRSPHSIAQVRLEQVYAETGRIPAAIAEYKQGLSGDEDGSIHFKLARLYQKQGNKDAADEAFRESRTLTRQWDNRARIGLEQSPTDTSRQ